MDQRHCHEASVGQDDAQHYRHHPAGEDRCLLCSHTGLLPVPDNLRTLQQCLSWQLVAVLELRLLLHAGMFPGLLIAFGLVLQGSAPAAPLVHVAETAMCCLQRWRRAVKE